MIVALNPIPAINWISYRFMAKSSKRVDSAESQSADARSGTISIAGYALYRTKNSIPPAD